MSLTKAQFERYHDALSRIDSSTAAELEKALKTAWRRGGRSDPKALRKITVDIAKDIADKYGLEAGAVSAALWEDIYYNDTGSRLEALLPNMEDYYYDYMGEAAAQMVEKYMDQGELDKALEFLTAITTKAVREWARRTQTSNTERVYRQRRKGADEARWARVPVGDDACAWCVMLASRGFVYVSEWTAKYRQDGEKYHDHCRCEVISSFDKNPVIEGYDPNEYLKMYEAGRRFDSQGRVDLTTTLYNMRQAYGLR